MGGVFVLLILMGLALVFGPIAASALGVSVGGAATAIMVLVGIAMLIVSAVAIIITKLYVKAKADEAFVRTGMGKIRVIMDGGSVVIPVVHEVIRVPLRTFRLEVSRRGADALLTADKLRADIKAEFFVRVQPDEADITNAARSLGDRTEHEGTIKALIEDKLVSALRTVAATKTLEELNSKRDEFVKAVMDSVTSDLKHNGFTLEAATISQLDQADASTLKDTNVFDAEGLLTIAKITEDKRTQANAIKRDRERERLGQDVQQRKEMLALEQERAQAVAEQAAAVATANAEQQQLTRTAQLKAEQAVAEAEYAKTQGAEVAKAKAEQAAEVAAQEKQRAVELAAQNRQQAVEVAERERQRAVADAEKLRVDAEAKRLAAEKARETEAQAIETVKVKAKADRDKDQAVIAAEAAAQTQFVTKQREADAEAYAVKKDADARREAAAADAEAITKKAEAEATAAARRAEGHRAEQMVPVDVESARVTVKQREVEVLKQELEAREAHGAAAQEFEIAKLRVVKEAEVRVEAARAVATMAAKVEATVFGTPEDAAKMTTAWMHGMGIAGTVNGFTAGATPETQDAFAKVLAPVGGALEAIAAHLGVKLLSPGAPNGASAGKPAAGAASPPAGSA